MVGRPPMEFSHDVANHICGEIAKARSLTRICQDDEGMPSMTTIFKWLRDDTHAAFAIDYARARETAADHLAAEILDIADDKSNDTLTLDSGREVERTEWTSRSRLRVDARKWLAAKMAPKRYGDLLQIEGDIAHRAVVKAEPLTPEEWAKRHGGEIIDAAPIAPRAGIRGPANGHANGKAGH